MNRYAAAGALAFLLPCLAAAQTTGIAAGFAPGSFFASKTAATAGDRITLFTVLYNQSEQDLTGDVTFAIDGADIGNSHFSLQPGETQTPTLVWTSTQGEHTASARIEHIVGSSDAQITLAHATAESIALSIAAPPPPTPTQQAMQTVTTVVQAAAPAAQTVFDSLEHLRQNAVNTLSQQLAPAPQAAAAGHAQGEVLGAETYRADASTTTSAAGGAFSSAWHMVLRALLYICNIRVLFYAVLLFVVYLLYKLVRVFLAERA